MASRGGHSQRGWRAWSSPRPRHRLRGGGPPSSESSALATIRSNWQGVRRGSVGGRGRASLAVGGSRGGNRMGRVRPRRGTGGPCGRVARTSTAAPPSQPRDRAARRRPCSPAGPRRTWRRLPGTAPSAHTARRRLVPCELQPTGLVPLPSPGSAAAAGLPGRCWVGDPVDQRGRRHLAHHAEGWSGRPTGSWWCGSPAHRSGETDPTAAWGSGERADIPRMEPSCP